MSIEDGYQISVSALTKHGRRRLHSFAYDRHSASWWPWNPPSRKQVRIYRGQIRESAITVNGVSVTKDRPSEPRRAVGLGANMSALKNWHGTIDLAAGVNVSPVVLEFILNALCSGGRHNVDLSDIKTVVSQLASNISKVGLHDGQKHQHAEQALYRQILELCS